VHHCLSRIRSLIFWLRQAKGFLGCGVLSCRKRIGKLSLGNWRGEVLFELSRACWAGIIQLFRVKSTEMGDVRNTVPCMRSVALTRAVRARKVMCWKRVGVCMTW
jgi:hypothetical protein